MIVLVSDLHLADTPLRSTINVPWFLRNIRRLVYQAREDGIKSLKIVLLGDIFEVLKSKEWLDQKVRPWEKSTSKHRATVASIFESIISSNSDFIEGIKSIITDYPFVSLHYIPGNHDLPLNTEMGDTARRRLQSILPLQISNGEKFGEYLVDPVHGVIARHGHEWDSTNRYVNGLAAIGDAVVIDLLLRFPIVVADKLGISEDDERLNFLHELDNVRPQSSPVMAKWLLAGLDRMSEDGSETGRRAIEEACYDIAKGLLEVKDSAKFESIEELAWWINFLTKLAPMILKYLGTLTTASHIALGGKEGAGPYREYAINDFQITDATGGEYRYVICGHTHNPLIAPLDIADSENRWARLYLNTGTWRRVYRYADITAGKKNTATFAHWDEECLISIYSPEEQARGLPAYEFNRLTRGVRV